MACRFLGLKHHIHSSMEKSLIERKMQYIKDRTESFDDYFPCRLKKCKLKHVRNWLNLFVTQLGCVFGKFPFVGWTRGWYAEDTENNYDAMASSLNEDAKYLERRK